MRDPDPPHGEFALIERLAAQLGEPGADVVVGIGDDCAAVDDGGDELLLWTVDLMAEGVHFLSGADPEGLGDKLLAVSLSDVAAMGGRPCHALVSMALPKTTRAADLDALYRGLRRRAARHGVHVVGGDTSASHGGLFLSLTLTGRAPRDRIWTRAGARPGDRVVVSGTLGEAAAGLALARRGTPPADGDEDVLLRRHHTPEPRVALAAALAGCDGVHAAIDLSDGLASDLGHVCRRSGVGVEIDLARLPIADALRRVAPRLELDPWWLSTCGGEDYELCLCVASGALAALEQAAAPCGVPLTTIGTVTGPQSPAVCWIGLDGEPVSIDGGWDHFRSG